MMIRTCPKCRAYYADADLAFCFADGMPLVDVDPNGEQWSEGSRVIQENATAGRKQIRRRWWRRIVLATLTTVLLAMAVTKSFTVETTKPRLKDPSRPQLQNQSAPPGLFLPEEPASDAATPLPSTSPSDFPS